MKKSHILLAVLLMAALVSCQETEFNGDEYVPKEGDIVFSMKGNGRATKSMDYTAPVKGTTIDMGSENGTRFYLEETVVNLNNLDFGPQTKGTPAYTENLGQLYADNLGVHADKGSFGEFAYANADTKIGTDRKWLYKHHYDSEPWPNEETPVGFYLRMPASPTGVTFATTDAYKNGAITFTYASPSTAAATQDILFGYRSLAKKDYPKTGIPAVLFHALTGVKFAVGNSDDEYENHQFAITEVIFSGLYDGGTCVISPADIESAEDESYDVTAWSSLTTRENFTISTENLVTEADETISQTIADYSKSDYDFPDSFTEAGTTKNLNDNNATKTFWLIPQAFEGRDDVMLTIKYNYDGATGLEAKLALGEILGERGIEWNAGELRTYTIRVADVNVQIDDEVTMSEDYDEDNFLSAVGSVKENVVITNTGNTPAYIRAAIVGQWIDEAGKPVFAFTDFKDGAIDILPVPSWYQDQFGSRTVAPAYNFGYFSELVGYQATKYQGSKAYTGEHWVKGTDGFYYYDTAVPAGGTTDEPLFASYTMVSVPNIRIAGESQEITFVLEVSTQAISAHKSNGDSWDSYTDAWAYAKAQ